MPLPVPNLDDRRFQDILDEMRCSIPRYCPEWTDHNLSDPGITLLELFAWLAEMLLYRLNRVPDKNYVKFLDLIGVCLEPARPATADLLFRLTAPQPDDVVIARGTAVGTLRTETQESITFSTDRDLAIRVPRLAHVLACREGKRFHDYALALRNPRQGLGVFGDHPAEDDGLYLGFANDLNAHVLAVTLHCRIEGIGVDPTDPPLAWEAWEPREGRWVPLEVEHDGTGGLNRDGVVIVRLPYGAGPATVDGKAAFWVRCRVLAPRPGQAGYSESPRISFVGVESLGGMVSASHAFKVLGEALGTSDGTPGQTFHLQTTPVLPRQEDEVVEVEGDNGKFEPWKEVSDFAASGRDDPHVVIDDVTGTVELGPRIRTPSGQELQYGRVPPAGRRLRMSSYRSGGGIEGNVGAHTLTVLKSSIPFIESVTNPLPAVGGTESEDVEHAKWRAPQVLRRRERAVTAADFEDLARQASPAVGRARCLPVAPENGQAPGVVRLQLVPAITRADGPLGLDELVLSARVRHEVQEFLDERRLLTCELALEAPAYAHVAVTARLRARPRASRERVAADALAALYRFVHPTLGGPDGKGWPFGRTLFVAEVLSLLQHVEGVDAVEDASLQPVSLEHGAQGQPATRVSPPDGGLLCSAQHTVEVV